MSASEIHKTGRSFYIWIVWIAIGGLLFLTSPCWAQNPDSFLPARPADRFYHPGEFNFLANCVSERPQETERLFTDWPNVPPYLKVSIARTIRLALELQWGSGGFGPPACAKDFKFRDGYDIATLAGSAGYLFKRLFGLELPPLGRNASKDELSKALKIVETFLVGYQEGMAAAGGGTLVIGGRPEVLAGLKAELIIDHASPSVHMSKNARIVQRMFNEWGPIGKSLSELESLLGISVESTSWRSSSEQTFGPFIQMTVGLVNGRISYVTFPAKE